MNHRRLIGFGLWTLLASGCGPYVLGGEMGSSDGDEGSQEGDDGSDDDPGDPNLPPLPKQELPEDWEPCGGELGAHQCGIHPASHTVVCNDDAPVWTEIAEGGVTLGVDMQDADCLSVEIELRDARGFFFNLGNSVSNNGGGGDGATASNDSEAWLVDTTFGVAHSDRTPYQGYVIDEEGAVNPSDDFVEIRVCDGYVEFRSDEFSVEREHPYIFQIDGDEYDAEKAGYNDQLLWIGLNRMVAGSRYGSGVADACVTVE